jgi:hypothetical protein
MNDNLENTIKKEKTKRNFLKKTLSTIGSVVLAGYIGITAACSSSTSPPPPTEKETILTTTQVRQLFNGSNATGTVTYEDGLGQSVTKNIGEQANLGQIAKGTTKNYNITINANGDHQRITNTVKLGGTQTINTNVADSNDLNVTGLLAYVLFDGKNKSWTPRTIKAIFNPDTDGSRLPQEYINEIKRAMTNIQEWSKMYGTDAYITGLAFDENGNKIQDTTVPPEGEIWVFKESQFSGATNATYPSGGSKVTSSKIFINTSSASYLMTYDETFDAFIQGEQNIGGFSQLPKWIGFMMNRPRDSNNYVITTGNESQTDIDAYSSSIAGDGLTFFIKPYTPDINVNIGDNEQNPITRQAISGRNNKIYGKDNMPVKRYDKEKY